MAESQKIQIDVKGPKSNASKKDAPEKTFSGGKKTYRQTRLFEATTGESPSRPD
jgi:hypothetical protein